MNKKRNLVPVLLMAFAGLAAAAGLASCSKKDGGAASPAAANKETVEAFNLDLPLTYNVPAAFAGMMGLPQLSANSLFDEANFKNAEAMTVICESKGAKAGTFTGSLLLSMDGTKALRMTISLHADNEGEFIYITEISFKNLV